MGLSANYTCAEEALSNGYGDIDGQILDATDGTPLLGATISLVGRFGGTFADTTGSFRLERLPAGNYILNFSHVGYDSKRLDSIAVTANRSTSVAVGLDQRLVTLKCITVTPSRFQIMGGEPAAQQTLTQSELATVPQLGDDFFRAVKRLPGMSGDDLSTRFRVRGGEYDEVLVTLDGLEIYEPFHLKDAGGGAISIVDVAAVDGIDLMTGGFPAKYGDRMSGAFDIRSRHVPPDHKRLSFGISLMNLRFLSEGNFDNNQGSWLVSARRGYIDLVLKLVGADDDIRPTYYDLFGKTRYQLSDKLILAASFLHAGDNLRAVGHVPNVDYTHLSSFDNSYGWLTLWSELHPRITARTIASTGRVGHNRVGENYSLSSEGVSRTVTDNKTFDFAGLQTDWEFDLASYCFLRAGFNLRATEADYDYISEHYKYVYYYTPGGREIVLDRIDTTMASLSPSGSRLGVYLSQRLRPWKTLTFELGARFDQTSYIDDETWSPRANVVYDLGMSTVLRVAWGQYYQSEGIDQVMVGDGETEFYPAETAEHWVAGLQHDFENGVHLRLEGYFKKYSDLRPDHRNSFYGLDGFSEASIDRIVVYRDKSVSRGLEIYLKKDTGGKMSWWASYVYAKTEDRVSSIGFSDGTAEIFNRDMPTQNDQRHTCYFDWSYRPNHSWQCNLALQYHTGWPYTGVHIVREPTGGGTYRVDWEMDEQLSSRHGSYRRVDLRINRYWSTGSGRITAFIELINVLGNKNVRGYNYAIEPVGTDWTLTKEPEYWFGPLPSFGVSYEIDF